MSKFGQKVLASAKQGIDAANVYLRIARVVNRVESGQCMVFISLADADAIMANPPPGWTANTLLLALDGRPVNIKLEGGKLTCDELRCGDHPIRLDRQLGAGIIEIVIGDAHERVAEIAARRTLPDGSGA